MKNSIILGLLLILFFTKSNFAHENISMTDEDNIKEFVQEFLEAVNQRNNQKILSMIWSKGLKTLDSIIKKKYIEENIESYFVELYKIDDDLAKLCLSIQDDFNIFVSFLQLNTISKGMPEILISKEAISEYSIFIYADSDKIGLNMCRFATGLEIIKINNQFFISKFGLY